MGAIYLLGNRVRVYPGVVDVAHGRVDCGGLAQPLCTHATTMTWHLVARSRALEWFIIHEPGFPVGKVVRYHNISS